MPPSLVRLRKLIDDSFDGSQARIAERLGVSRGRVSQILTGAEEFTDRVAKSWARKLKKPDSFFFESTSGAVTMLSPIALEIAEAFDAQAKTEREARIIREQCLAAIESRGKAFSRRRAPTAESQ